MATALEQLKSEYITEQELAMFFNVDTRRLQDLRSKGQFIKNCYKVTAQCRLYRVQDVLDYIQTKLLVTSKDNED